MRRLIAWKDLRWPYLLLGLVFHASLTLLLDLGHCLISDEDPSVAAAQAGRRLGHVHLDDNDSVGDLHWPLLTGRLTLRNLEELVAALRELSYRGGFALELNAAHGDPVRALGDGRELVARLLP